jgi:hypothetical protein
MPGITNAFEIGVLFFLQGTIDTYKSASSTITHLQPKERLHLRGPGTRPVLREILGIDKYLLQERKKWLWGL